MASDLIDFSGNLQNTGFSVAISDSDVLTDTTTWTVANIFNATLIPDPQGCPGDQTSAFDSCQMALDKHAIYVSFNVFPANGQYSSTLFVIQKKSLLHPGPVVATGFHAAIGYNGPGEGILEPVLNFDEDACFGYVIATNSFFYGLLDLYRVIDPGSTSPMLSPVLTLTVPTTSEPETNPQVPILIFWVMCMGSLDYCK